MRALVLLVQRLQHVVKNTTLEMFYSGASIVAARKCVVVMGANLTFGGIEWT